MSDLPRPNTAKSKRSIRLYGSMPEPIVSTAEGFSFSQFTELLSWWMPAKEQVVEALRR